MNAIVTTMWAIAMAATGATAPAPEVRILDRATFARVYCGSPTCAVGRIGGFVRPDMPGVVNLKAPFDPANIYHAAMLLHEFVHVIQMEQGRVREDTPCAEWVANELQAVAIQERFLAAHYVATPHFYKIRASYLNRKCPEGEA